MTLVQNLPLVLLGLDLHTHGLLVVLLRVHTVAVHANLRSPPWLAPYIALPAFHHRHHAEGPDANFASLLPFLDRCFGTFAVPEQRG